MAGCASDWPLICMISNKGSFAAWRFAYRALIGPPINSFSENIQPFETLELCGIAKHSIPCARNASR